MDRGVRFRRIDAILGSLTMQLATATGCLECTPRTDRDALAEGTVTKEVRAKEPFVISALVRVTCQLPPFQTIIAAARCGICDED